MRRASFGLLLALQGAALSAKPTATQIDLSVAADGACEARIGATVLKIDAAELDAKLPALLPNRKAPIRFSASYEKVPDRCFGPVLSSLQRLGYGAISFAAEQPPLGAELTVPGPGQ